jgi:LmbE family N-acetylglucosaminyl deacetylase
MTKITGMQRAHTLNQIGIHKGDTMLVVMPHPDDETGFIGGFLAKCCNGEVNVRLVCVTDGAKSTLRFGLSDEDDLKEVRKKELSNALNVLGIDSFIHANFGDGEIEDHMDEISEYVENEITAFHPQFVVTLEPDGGYGHPDHIALSTIVTKLYEKDKNRFTLIYATVAPGWLADEGSRNMARKEIHPIYPNVRVYLSESDASKKVKAFKAHSSQFSVEETMRDLDEQTVDMMEHEYLFIVGK